MFRDLLWHVSFYWIYLLICNKLLCCIAHIMPHSGWIRSQEGVSLDPVEPCAFWVWRDTQELETHKEFFSPGMWGIWGVSLTVWRYPLSYDGELLLSLSGTCVEANLLKLAINKWNRKFFHTIMYQGVKAVFLFVILNAQQLQSPWTSPYFSRLAFNYFTVLICSVFH